MRNAIAVISLLLCAPSYAQYNQGEMGRALMEMGRAMQAAKESGRPLDYFDHMQRYENQSRQQELQQRQLEVLQTQQYIQQQQLMQQQMQQMQPAQAPSYNCFNNRGQIYCLPR